MDSETSQETSKWHWIVCFAVPVATILEAALPHSFGSFIAHFQRTTDLHLAELAWLTATTSAIPCIFLPIFTMLVRKYPSYHRHLAVLSFVLMSTSCFLSSALKQVEFMFITYTLLYGLSSAILLAVCVVIISEYFPVSHQHHILASSLYQIGYPVAAAGFSPLMGYLISNIGWQRALQILGGIQLLFGCSVGLLFKPYQANKPKDENTELTDKESKNKTENEEEKISKSADETQMDKAKANTFSCTRQDFVSRPQMYTWFAAKLLNYICWFSMRTNLTPFLHFRGHTLTNSALVMTTYACGEIVLCIVAAYLSPFLRGKLLTVHVIGTTGMAVLMFSWSSLPANYSLELIVAVLIGVFVQITLTFGYPASVEILNFEMSTSWTVTNIFAGIGILISPVLGGVTFDATQSFMLFFYTDGGLWATQFVLHCITAIVLYKCGNTSSDSYEPIS